MPPNQADNFVPPGPAVCIDMSASQNQHLLLWSYLNAAQHHWAKDARILAKGGASGL